MGVVLCLLVIVVVELCDYEVIVYWDCVVIELRDYEVIE